MRTFLFLALVVLAGTGGEIAATYGMKRAGEIKDLAPRAMFRVFRHAFQQGWIWFGISLMALAYLILLNLLSWANVSFVVPATAFSYVVGAPGAKFLLGENVGRMRCAGILLVFVGVALVCAR